MHDTSTYFTYHESVFLGIGLSIELEKKVLRSCAMSWSQAACVEISGITWWLSAQSPLQHALWVESIQGPSVPWQSSDGQVLENRSWLTWCKCRHVYWTLVSFTGDFCHIWSLPFDVVLRRTTSVLGRKASLCCLRYTVLDVLHKISCIGNVQNVQRIWRYSVKPTIARLHCCHYVEDLASILA